MIRYLNNSRFEERYMDFTPPQIISPAIVKFADKYYPHTKISRLFEKYTYINDATPPDIASRKIKRLADLGNKKVYAVYYICNDDSKMGIPYLLIKEKKNIRHANIEEIGEIHKKNNIVNHTPSYVPEAVIKKLDEHVSFVTSSGDIRLIRYRTTWKNYEVYSYDYDLYEPKLVGMPVDILYDCNNARFPNKEERHKLKRISPIYPQGNTPTLCKNLLSDN